MKKIEKEDWKNSVLFALANLGDVALFNHWVDKGLDIDAQDEGGDTALHYAARGGHNQIIVYLLERQAKITLNKKNRTPLFEAYANHRMETARIITKFSVEKNSVKNLIQLYNPSRINTFRQRESVRFVNDCKNHINKNYLNRNIFSRVLARHNERAQALYIALGRCSSVKEAKELIKNQCNLLKGLPSRPIAEYLLQNRWSKEIKNKPDNVEKSSFYKMLRTLPAASKYTDLQQKERVLQPSASSIKK